MIDMQRLLVETLKDIGVPISFVARGESRLPLVVFNFREIPKEFWDEEESVTKFEVMINIFSRENYVHIKNAVLKKMKDAGFIKDEIPVAIYLEDIEIYNQPMSFNYYHIEELQQEEGDN
nr:MAG TPA: Protein of unknown function (DUF806) [Caudoviricetes sp.]